MSAWTLRLLLPALTLIAGSACAGEAPPRAAMLEAHGDVVHDRKTDLTWQRCSHGQRWDGTARCTGEVLRLTFDEAKALEADGWRVPTLDELKSIVVKGRKPTIDSALFPDTPPAYFWATGDRDTSLSWYVYFDNGIANHYFPPRTNRDSVRLVRSGRWPAARKP